MKGVIFLKLEEFVDETFGEMAWDEALTNTDLISDGAYTSIALYEDKEFFSIINTLCKQHEMDGKTAQFAFGKWIFHKLLEIAPHDMKDYVDTFSFLRAVDSVIHQEVMKIHKDAVLPEFKFIEQTEKMLIMEYISPRGLFHFCEGLIVALAEHLNENVKISFTVSDPIDHKGCIFEIEKI